jgi:hypothetical protein
MCSPGAQIRTIRAVDAGFATLIGAVVGFLGAFVIQEVRERRSRRWVLEDGQRTRRVDHEDRLRDERRAAYADFVAVAHDLLWTKAHYDIDELVRREVRAEIKDQLGEEVSSHVDKVIETGLYDKQLVDKITALDHSYAALRLVASPAVMRAASDCFRELVARPLITALGEAPSKVSSEVTDPLEHVVSVMNQEMMAVPSS